MDDRTGLPVKNASIYEKMLLVSTITNEKGFFSIKVKNEGQVTLTISKEFYKDSSISFLNDVTISPHQRRTYYSVDATADKTDRNWLGRMFISSKQRMQNINLGGFMASVPFQTSFTPGLSIQAEGIYNTVKDTITGVQVAGIFQ